MNHAVLIGLVLSLLLVGVAAGACSIFPCPTPTPVSGYTFENGTPIPADYVCPVHGWQCPDDPRPMNERPGYVAPAPTPTRAPHPVIPPFKPAVRTLEPLIMPFERTPAWDGFWQTRFGERDSTTGFLQRERKPISPWGF